MRISDWSSDVCSSDLGALQQGLRDLAAWVEKGVRPSSTQYRVDDAQVVLPDNAERRGGIQPVITLQANGGVRADVAVGATVSFGARIDVPRSEEHTSELQSLMRISYAVFCLKKKTNDDTDM